MRPRLIPITVVININDPHMQLLAREKSPFSYASYMTYNNQFSSVRITALCRINVLRLILMDSNLCGFGTCYRISPLEITQAKIDVDYA